MTPMMKVNLMTISLTTSHPSWTKCISMMTSLAAHAVHNASEPHPTITDMYCPSTDVIECILPDEAIASADVVQLECPN